MQAPPQPLMAIRNITDPALANVTVPLAKEIGRASCRERVYSNV